MVMWMVFPRLDLGLTILVDPSKPFTERKPVKGGLFRWMHMEVLLGIHGVWDVVDLGSDNAKQNNIVKGLLFQSFPEDLILQIRNLETGKEMSEAIKLFLGITSMSATFGQVMSEHKLVKKFLTSLPRRFVHIVAGLEQVLDLKTTRFEDVVRRLKAYEKRVKQKDKANNSYEKLLYARMDYSNKNCNSSRGRGRGSYSRGCGRGCGQGRGQGNSQNQGQRDSSKNHEDNRQKCKQKEQRGLSHIKCYLCDKFGHFVSKCPDHKRHYEPNLSETHEGDVNHEEGTFFMMNHIQETIMNEEKYTPPKNESNTDEDDVCANRLYKAQLKVGKPYCLQANIDEESWLWHVRVGHIGFGDVNLMHMLAKGVPVTKHQDQLCESCMLRKQIKKSFSKKATYKASKILEMVHGDICGAITPSTQATSYCSRDLVSHDKPEGDEDKYESDVTPIPEPRNYYEAKLKPQRLKEMKFKLKAILKNNTWKLVPLPKGIEVSQGKNCVEIKQERYAIKILKEAGMEDCNENLYPMEKDLKLSKAEDEPEVKATQYQKMVGFLRYILHTRPDLTYSVGVMLGKLAYGITRNACGVAVRAYGVITPQPALCPCGNAVGDIMIPKCESGKRRWVGSWHDGACARKQEVEEVFDFELGGICSLPTFILGVVVV
nr:hypothetical protein [Tanacetum cinerariifolium]